MPYRILALHQDKIEVDGEEKEGALTATDGIDTSSDKESRLYTFCAC